MNEVNDQARVLAQTVYEIRILLAGYLGGDAQCELPVRQAAHLAYALHNEAASVSAGGTFDLETSLVKIKRVDEMLGSRFEAAIVEALSSQLGNEGQVLIKCQSL